MKKNRVKISVMTLLSFLTMFSLTSCFSDSDAEGSDVPTDEENAAYQKRVKGTYVGNCYYSYMGKNSKGQIEMMKDSITNIEWTISGDGQIHAEDLPVALTAKALKYGTSFDYVCDALSKHDNVPFDAKAQMLKSFDNWNFPFIIIPKDHIKLEVDDNGRKHKVVIYFQNFINLQGLYYDMSGLYKAHVNQLFMNLPVGRISVDDVDTGVSPSMFLYSGKKKEDKEDKK